MAETQYQNQSRNPLVYEALISQNSPIATTTDPAMVAGQIWTLDAYNVVDAATIAALTLVSGTLYAIGSKYLSTTDQTLIIDAATTLSYDGAPFVVSNDFKPLFNTVGNVVLSYVAAGTFKAAHSSFVTEKTIPYIGSNILGGNVPYVNIVEVTGLEVVFETKDGFKTLADDELYYTPITIRAYQ